MRCSNTTGAPQTLQVCQCARNEKNILVILVYLCSRPAQGGGAGLVRYYHQNKTAPEPPLPILLVAIEMLRPPNLMLTQDK